MVPIVLYNGDRRWTAPEDVRELFGEVPEALGRYRPRLRYLLVDEGRFSNEDLPASRNLAAALFRLEQSRTPADAAAVVESLLQWLVSPEQAGLRRSFTTWLTRVLVPARLGGQPIDNVNELEEVRTMLATRVKEWTEQWKKEGLEQGLERGRQEGRQEGLRAGQARLLLSLLEARFGSVPGDVRARVEAAGAEDLETWGRRILDAESLGAVFGEAPPVPGV